MQGNWRIVWTILLICLMFCNRPHVCQRCTYDVFSATVNLSEKSTLQRSYKDTSFSLESSECEHAHAYMSVCQRMPKLRQNGGLVYDCFFSFGKRAANSQQWMNKVCTGKTARPTSTAEAFVLLGRH